jgi:hypothetical protein
VSVLAEIERLRDEVERLTEALERLTEAPTKAPGWNEKTREYISPGGFSYKPDESSRGPRTRLHNLLERQNDEAIRAWAASSSLEQDFSDACRYELARRGLK